MGPGRVGRGHTARWLHRSSPHRVRVDAGVCRVLVIGLLAAATPAACGPRGSSDERLRNAKTATNFDPPSGLDWHYPVPENNPLTVEKAELGQRLFFDPLLSRDRSMSCATCHRPELAFSDGRRLARGVDGRVGTRNTPTLVNRAYGRSFFWDGRAAALEEAVLMPIVDPNELDLDLEAMTARLTTDRSYHAAFVAVFGRPPAADDAARALASFVRTLMSGAAPVDLFLEGGEAALSADARRGRGLFFGKANCFACHVGPNLTDESFHNTGVSAGGSADLGRFAFTGRPEDRGRFKTPTLREVARTSPYMHDGSIASLADVIDFYDRGGHPNPNLDPEIRPLRLTADEKRDLVRFLEAVTSGADASGWMPGADSQAPTPGADGSDGESSRP